MRTTSPAPNNDSAATTGVQTKTKSARARRIGVFAVAMLCGVAAALTLGSLAQVASVLSGFAASSRDADHGTGPEPFAAPTRADLAASSGPQHAHAASDPSEPSDPRKPSDPSEPSDPTEPRDGSGAVETPRAAAPSPPPRPPAPALSDEHLPAAAAAAPFASDPAAFRTRLESLLASDPETLRQVQALLDEPDVNLRAENLELLQDTFGVE